MKKKWIAVLATAGLLTLGQAIPAEKAAAATTATTATVTVQAGQQAKTTAAVYLYNSYGYYMGTVPKGATVTVKSVSGGWAQITYSSKTGFVNASYLQATTTATTTTTTNTTTTASTLSAYEQKVVDLTNAERAKNGLSALKIDTELSKVARAKSQDMYNKNYFSHTSPTYGSPFDMMKTFGITYRAAGENIAMGQTTPEAVVTAWMNSAGHRANILNSTYTHIGVGYVSGKNIWTQMFIAK